MRNGLWSIVVGGLVGALLGAAPVGAQPFLGGLPECVRQLNTCNADLGNCQADLAECQVFPGDGVDSPALSYTDNMDGTFTDNNTQLMWEKKVAGGSSGCPTDSANLHGVDSTCTWAQATGVWIAAINADNLGGHNDWRVPNVKELLSIVDYSRRNPATSVPGSTAMVFYWSSTNSAGSSSGAWVVEGFSGFTFAGTKNESRYVRAVRGGR